MATPSGRFFWSSSKSALMRGQPVQQRVKRNDATHTFPRRSARRTGLPLRSVREKSATGPKSSAASCDVVGDDRVGSLEVRLAGRFPVPVKQPETASAEKKIAIEKRRCIRRTWTSSAKK